MTILEFVLLAGLVLTAIVAPLCKHLLNTVILYLSFSVLMAILWSLLQSPDLAITEAAVGAGIGGILLFLTLNKIHELKRPRDE